MSEVPKIVELEKADALLLQKVHFAFQTAKNQAESIGLVLLKKYVPEGNGNYNANVDAGRFELVEEPNG